MLTMRRMGALTRICLVSIPLIVVAAGLALAAPPEADTISKDELLPLLCKPDTTVIDLRFGRDWYDSTIKIKCATREDPMKPGQWMDKYPKDRMLVLYCD